MLWCYLMAPLRRTLDTILPLVQVEKRKMRVIRLSEKFKSRDVGPERNEKITMYNRRKLGWLSVSITDLDLLLGRAGTRVVVKVRGPFLWQRTCRVCFGEWPVSWHLIWGSEKVYVSSSAEWLVRNEVYEFTPCPEQRIQVEILSRRSCLRSLRIE